MLELATAALIATPIVLLTVSAFDRRQDPDTAEQRQRQRLVKALKDGQ